VSSSFGGLLVDAYIRGIILLLFWKKLASCLSDGSSIAHEEGGARLLFGASLE